MRKHAFDETEMVVSATECTGLLPALPEEAPEAEDTMRLYAVHPPRQGEHKPCGKKGKKR